MVMGLVLGIFFLVTAGCDSEGGTQNGVLKEVTEEES